MNLKKIRILCLDIEGGHGGSSRSLFYSIEAITKKKKKSIIDITVICRKKSWLVNEYKKMGITCLIEESMPRFTSLSKTNRNIYQLILFIFFIWPKSIKFRKKILQMKNYDVLHFNHVSLGFLALWCKYKDIGSLKTMHIRTMPPRNIFTKMLYYISKIACNSFIYITENEKKHLHSLIGKPEVNEKIIYNPVKSNYKKNKNLLKDEKRFILGILSNFSYNRGVDRTVEIFEKIPLPKRKNFVFVFGGDMTLEQNIPNIPKKFFKNKLQFSDFIKSKGYEKNFIFLGQLQNPEELMRNIHVLLKPTRLANPWGRDILEALAMGKPVISLGEYQKFVENNLTGLLQKNYNPQEIADWLLHLEKNRSQLKVFSIECKKRIRHYCFPKTVSEQLISVWLQK